MKDTELYIPAPVNTDGVTLPEELTPVLERLAENTHEIWAKARMDAGWVYGPVRDDAKKTHPCLVPYGDLSADEKVYDRKTSEETLKLLYAMGYRLTKRRKS